MTYVVFCTSISLAVATPATIYGSRSRDELEPVCQQLVPQLSYKAISRFACVTTSGLCKQFQTADLGGRHRYKVYTVNTNGTIHYCMNNILWHNSLCKLNHSFVIMQGNHLEIPFTSPNNLGILCQPPEQRGGLCNWNVISMA